MKYIEKGKVLFDNWFLIVNNLFIESYLELLLLCFMDY